MSLHNTTTSESIFNGDKNPITTLHPDIIKSHILNKLDGPTLASTSCAAPQLLSLCSDDKLWKDICMSTWPSTTDPHVEKAISTFASGHKSFFSDSFPSFRGDNITGLVKKSNISDTSTGTDNTTCEIISAVDIYCQDKLIYSNVIVTETESNWFQTSPFQVDLLGRKETVPTPIEFESEEGPCMARAKESLRVSWILIDPVKKRAVNLASRGCVEARRHWLTEDIKLRYATVVGTVQCSVVVTCGGKVGSELHVRDVSMQTEDVEGKIVNGKDSLVILSRAMEGQRCKSDSKLEKENYEGFLRLRIEERERKMRKEKGLDLVCIMASVTFFLSIWIFLMYR